MLPKLLAALDKLCFDLYKCSILNFLTIGALAWYSIITQLPKEAIEGDKYDKNRHKITRKNHGMLPTNVFKNDREEDDFIR